MKQKIDYSKINNIVFADIFRFDFPDFVDAFIDSADYDDKPMTEDQLNELNEDSDFVSEALQDYLY